MTHKFKAKETKREVISETPWKEKMKYKGADGKMKKKTVEGKDTIESEIETVHLVKIAPMVFLCIDNNKIVMIPFSIQFSQKEYLEHIAKQSVALQTYYKTNEPEAEDPDPQD